MSQIAAIHKAFLSSKGVSTDSRSNNKDVIFFALKGANFDGNKYVKDVLDKGAAYAVADDTTLTGLKNVFIVDDVLSCLQELALYHRRYLGIPIIAITGTNGKTTTKELVAAVTSQKFKIKATAGNYNNHIGVPLTLLSMDTSIELGIVEMGANHIGEIELLCKIAEPDYGMITNVGKAHLEGFGSFEGVKTAKGELYKYLKNNNGRLFINHDNQHLMQMAADIDNRVEFGKDCGFVYGQITKNNPFIAIKWHQEADNSFSLQTQLIGAYNLENILSAICIGQFFEVNIEDINAAIENYTPTNNRSQFIKSENNQIIMDAYNANPSSMQVALQNFSEIDAQNKVVILGSMKELGDNCNKEHQKLLDTANSLSFERVIIIGSEFKDLNTSGADFYLNNDILIKEMEAKPLISKSILIKGSRSNKLEELLPHL
ncbi:UDP-N-acetylmuramoyl-tripeptide--D-alanyl-D-alanine ligase [Carboxylicivirga sp. A043]|uniref:UDP-N-acetylmuramoyl-tripeptide--D-alanyl-D- alanine ligase n=1 Tax=Carboxylicivirga litoralis TaxID=2816963 RepID=UPI0021CB6B40|nr:UDP-N-acetylmuramoyl-tripeptide--D-alanyl-D-alanine ligase [Carboxylicivirga sp. A043]MCU4155003.1 UDP-N-acetylmuramoyl-tripeptide--D-alanyl-D-alanine ligase [Carboxylicivirga sp. A043]